VAWGYGLTIAEAVYNQVLLNQGEYEGLWQGAKELVDEAFGVTQYRLALVGD